MNEQNTLERARNCLSAIKEKKLSLNEIKDQSLNLASWMLNEGNQTQRTNEKQRQTQLAGMIDDPYGKTFTSYMADQCFRSKDTSRVADQLIYLLKRFGIPKYLSPWKQIQMKLFMGMGKPFSKITIPAMTYVLRKETEAVILPGEQEKLSGHMSKRRQEGVRINLNHLGEAILGEEEAKHRLQLYIDTLTQENVEYVSVKISTIFSQINLLAWDESLKTLSDRLRQLYRAAQKKPFIRATGEKVQKFVNLDMEEYRDLRLTVDLFKNVLSEDEFRNLSAGIVLQAYLPDSHQIQKELTEWAIERKRQGGASIKIRIVKGANLAMEKVEASLKGWEQAPYTNKIDVDANYKRMLIYGCQKPHAEAVHLGIASHNLFDIAFGMLLRAIHGVENEVCFEMLEGMAPHLSRVVKSLSGEMLLYCPAAKRDEFQNAIAYLIRRLDENTAEDNFLRHSFQLSEGSLAWKQQAELFQKGFAAIESAPIGPRRKQNRLEPPKHLPIDASFENEADTDFSLSQNRAWAQKIINEWSSKEHGTIPLVVAGQEIYHSDTSETKEGKGTDPNICGKSLYTYTMASQTHVEQALEAAVSAQLEWENLSVQDRSDLFAKAAQIMRERRGDLIGAMIADAGKTFAEADVEVSEAIDMAEFYRRSREELESHSELSFKAKGVIAVIPPWNFPCAIPAGGIISALLAGNSVLFKPSRETILVGYHLCKILWDAGIPKQVLQFLTGSSAVMGNTLISDKRLAGVILTGSTDTAKQMLSLRPNLHLMAETGGKNPLIVTNMADRDLAIKDIVHSAFGHAGQKCSAASLLILEKEVYNDPQFQKQLKDAAASLKVGSSWKLSTKVNPLIHAPEKDLLRALTKLDDDEFWLLEPKQDSDNPNLWSPGIKWGVKENSYSHQTEFFGPVLSVLCAEDLEHAIRIANGTKYGLTSGIHSLDDREHAVWLNKIEAGNYYINRGITGAIVRRQPFGGCKESCFGPGPKAGGPNYLIPLMEVSQKSLPKSDQNIGSELKSLVEWLISDSLLKDEMPRWEKALKSYSEWILQYRKDHDPSRILGQDNFLRYIPYKKMALRIEPSDTLIDCVLALAAAKLCKTNIELSFSVLPHPKLSQVFPEFIWMQESHEQFCKRVSQNQYRRIRKLSHPADTLFEAAASIGCHIHAEPVLASGRIELLHYLREIAISFDYHRYGNLGDREHNL